MQADESFRNKYRNLERRMKALAESDGDIYLPNPEPSAPVHYVLICMEPSLGGWARSAEDAKRKVEAGFRNFLASMETSILHFCVQRYLCRPGEHYHMTDFSKGAMLVQRAGSERSLRYDRWYPLLLEELDICARPDARIIAVGGAVAKHLDDRGFSRPFTRVIHYSRQAALARNHGIRGREQEFMGFKSSLSLSDVNEAAGNYIRAAQLPDEVCGAALSALRNGRLTESGKKLIFNYKLNFEPIRGTQAAGRV